MGLQDVGPNLISLFHLQPRMARAIESSLIRLLLLEISPKAETFPFKSHWKVPKSLLPCPLAWLALGQTGGQGKDVRAIVPTSLSSHPQLVSGLCKCSEIFKAGEGGWLAWEWGMGRLLF